MEFGWWSTHLQCTIPFVCLRKHTHGYLPHNAHIHTNVPFPLLEGSTAQNFAPKNIAKQYGTA